MSLSEVGMGFVIASPVMAVAGACFAVSISANPFVSTIGKAIGWPLSIIAGYVGAVHWGAELLPYWDDWAQRLVMFGPGFFFTWMLIGVVFHEDTIVHEVSFLRFLFKTVKRFFEPDPQSGGAPKYKAYANKKGGRS